MDRSLFQPNAPGQLVPIDAPEPDWAFVPAPLPSDWALPPGLTALLIEARQNLARLDGAGRYMPANTLLLRPLQRREALRSSALEGTFATAEELLAYGLEPKDPTSDADPANAWREVFNYDAALQQGQQVLAGLPLSSRVIRLLHETLLNRVRGTDRTPGQFRRRQVHIGSARRFIPPPADKVEALVADLERYVNNPSPTDPLVRAFLAHYQFESIHPFLDGNGRVGRLVLSLMVYQGCGLQAPWLYLSPYFERHKDEYIDRLFRVSTHADWHAWIELCLRGTIEESRNALGRIDKLLEIRRRYDAQMAKDPRASGRLQIIVNELLSSPLTTIPETAKMTGVTYPTAQSDIRKLMRMGVLEESKRDSKPRFYIARDFFEGAYADDVT